LNEVLLRREPEVVPDVSRELSLSRQLLLSLDELFLSIRDLARESCILPLQSLNHLRVEPTVLAGSCPELGNLRLQIPDRPPLLGHLFIEFVQFAVIHLLNLL
jgi:hypothetical protein